MKSSIESYVIIRNQKVAGNGELLLESGEKHGPAFFTGVYKHFGINYPKFYKMDNLCKLGFLASEILLKGKDLNKEANNTGTAVVIYNAASSLDTDRNHQQSIHNRASYFPSPSVFVYTLANIVIGEICIRNKFYGEGSFFIEEEFNADAIYTYVKQLFKEGMADHCITGWLNYDHDTYEGILYLIKKTGTGNTGIAIFEPGKLKDIYLQRN